MAREWFQCLGADLLRIGLEEGCLEFANEDCSRVKVRTKRVLLRHGMGLIAQCGLFLCSHRLRPRSTSPPKPWATIAFSVVRPAWLSSTTRRLIFPLQKCSFRCSRMCRRTVHVDRGRQRFRDAKKLYRPHARLLFVIIARPRRATSLGDAEGAGPGPLSQVRRKFVLLN